ncbi:MAG: YvcK family protein [Anaerolineae bacterium]|nr:YvcK family protein [Anaerolineae bacterium]
MAFTKWITPGIGVKRWLLLLAIGNLLLALGLALIIAELNADVQSTSNPWTDAVLEVTGGAILILLALVMLARSILAPYRTHEQSGVLDVMYAHSRRQRGIKVVAIGGGTGLPSVLRALKPYTSNITAVVTVADDGGSSGRLRRELGVLPPGDLRNNIAALADDENLMTQLFQHRFNAGDLGGHAFGNLFISAMAAVTGSLEEALIETERVLNIQGRVLPATMHEVALSAHVRLPGQASPVVIEGESNISSAGGKIEKVFLKPDQVEAYSESIQSILDADVVVIGPGSLYTSILPNLLINGIAEALRATSAFRIYVCNVATQPGETDDYTVADHVMALENHIGRGVIQAVLANNVYPTLNAGVNTRYVRPAPAHHEIFQRYDVRYTDLTDPERPWRHDPGKLAVAIFNLTEEEKIGGLMKPIFSEAVKPV